jgi:hypothetical protein
MLPHSPAAAADAASAARADEFRIPADYGSLHVRVVEGTDLFAALESGLDRRGTQLCLDISALYGGSPHCSYSTVAISHTEGAVVFDNETYVFESVKPEHCLQIALIGLRNYTTGYGISPQSLGVLKIPVERLHQNTTSQWYPFYSPNGVSTLRSAVKLEITYTRDTISFRSEEIPRAPAPGPEAAAAAVPPSPVLDPYADANLAAAKFMRRPSFSNFGRSQSKLGARRPSMEDLDADVPAGRGYERMPVGLADYFVIVGPTAAAVNADDTPPESGPWQLRRTGDVSIWDRFPRNDYPDGPMPPKVEWFCFPDGAVYEWSSTRPDPRLSSFVMLAGDSRQYGVTLMFFIKAMMSHGAPPPKGPSDLRGQGAAGSGSRVGEAEAGEGVWWKGQEDVSSDPATADGAGAGASPPPPPSKPACCWMSVCMCFLTRAPFVQQLSVCLLKLYAADILPSLGEWEDGKNEKKARLFKYSPLFIESSFLLVSLCFDCPLPIPGKCSRMISLF